MRTRLMQIEEQIERADQRRRAVRFLAHTAAVAAAMACVVLLVGIAAVVGLVESRVTAIVLLSIGAVGCAVELAFMSLLIWASPVERQTVAAEIERNHGELLDRLNTVAYLERTAPDSPLIPQIAMQAANVLAKSPPRPPFSTHRAWVRAVLFAVMTLATIAFYRWAAPWERLRAAEEVARNEAQAETRFALPPAQTSEADALSADQVWGEVTISEPGADIRAAEFESVSLQIEAASSQPLNEVKLLSTVNGESLIEQPLPIPEDPTYAVYPTELALTDMNVQPWDIVAYYAQAKAQDGSMYTSDLYFVEVFPLSEQLKQLPGGEEGTAYRLLQALTALTERQQEIMRGQHRLDHLPESESAQWQLGYEQLAVDQQRLAAAAQRFAAATRVQWQHDPALQKWVEQLDQTVQALETAQQALQDPAGEVNPQQTTQAALQQLAQSRSELHELAPHIPEQLNSPSRLASEPADLESPPPVTAEQLREAQEFAARIAEQLRDQAEKWNQLPKEDLAQSQQQITRELEQLPSRQPEAASTAAEPFVTTYEASVESQKQLQNEKPQAQSSAEHAAQQAQEWSTQLKQHELLTKIAERLECLQQVQQQPEAFDNTAMKKQAEDTEQLREQIEQFAAQQPNHSQQLREQLNDKQQNEALKSACKKLGNCKSNGEKSAACQSAGQGMGQLAQALGNDTAQSAANQHHASLERELNTMEATKAGISAARQQVRQQLSAQRGLQKQSSNNDPGTLQQLAGAQQQNLEAFRQARQQHEPVMSEVPQQAQFAEDALQSATEAMRQGAAGHERAEQAGNALQELDTSLDQLEEFQSMADAFRLPELTQRHLRQLQNMQQAPERYSEQHFQQAAQASQRLAEHAQRLGQDPGVQESLGDDLSKAMGPQAMEQIQQAAEQLQNSSSAAQRQAALNQLREQLRPLSNANRQPDVGRTAEGNDNLRESGYEALARALRELETLSKAHQGKGRLTPGQEQMLREDALTQFIEGIFGVYGHNQRSQQVVARLEKELVDLKEPVNQEMVRELMSEIQDLRREAAIETEDSVQSEELSNVDPSRLPPGYRQAIERYFQKLSEER